LSRLALHVDIDLLWCKRGPQEAPSAVLHSHVGEREAGPRAIDPQQIGLAGAAWEDPVECQEKARKWRRLALAREVLELRREHGDVIDNQVRCDLGDLTQMAQVLPGPEPGIDLHVIDGVEPRVGTVDPVEEGEQVYAAEEPLERPSQEGC